MQNPREDLAETRPGRRSRAEGWDDKVCSGFRDTSLAVKSPSVNEARLEKTPPAASTQGLSPACGLTSPSEMQILDWKASFAQVVETVVAKFRVEDSLDFFSKWGALS